MQSNSEEQQRPDHGKAVSCNLQSNPGHKLTTQTFQQPAAEQEEYAKADQTRGTAKLVHYGGEVEEQDRQGKSCHSKVDSFGASSLNAPRDETDCADGAP